MCGARRTRTHSSTSISTERASGTGPDVSGHVPAPRGRLPRTGAEHQLRRGLRLRRGSRDSAVQHAGRLVLGTTHPRRPGGARARRVLGNASLEWRTGNGVLCRRRRRACSCDRNDPYRAPRRRLRKRGREPSSRASAAAGCKLIRAPTKRKTQVLSCLQPHFQLGEVGARGAHFFRENED
jgi:hypothetical protein